MEVCLPVTRPFVATGDASTRELPTARLACVTLRGSQCDFPAVLEGYDIVYAWIEQHGYRHAGPPWEIWLSDPCVTAAAEVMEIAWPFEEK